MEDTMKIAIAGGSGFVGKALQEELLKNGHQLFILTRNPNVHRPANGITYVQWLGDGDRPELQLEGTGAIVNLAGESLNSGRWTPARKRRILDSRLTATREVKRIIDALEHKPSVLLNASAIGYYGISRDETFTEAQVKRPSDFLSETVDLWEREAERSGIRTVYMRFGVVLGKKGGALPRMALPYRLFGGGTVGSGRQVLSWIHIHDVVRAAIYCVEHPALAGPVNFTAPEPAAMKAFGQTIGSVLRKPHWLPVPGFMLKLLLGEMSVLVLEGQTVLSSKLLDNGFTFSHPDLEGALTDLLR